MTDRIPLARDEIKNYDFIQESFPFNNEDIENDSNLSNLFVKKYIWSCIYFI